MAQLALSLGGSIAGSYFGPVGSAVGGMAGSLIGGEIDKLIGLSPSAASAVPTKIGLRVKEKTLGEDIMELWGTFRLPGYYIWSTHLVPKLQPGSDGVKGVGTSAQYTYSMSMAIAFAKGPIQGVSRIWADKKLIYDVRRAVGTHPFSRGAGFRIYLGTETQLPNSKIQAHLGSTLVPAFRGLAYVVIEHIQLADFGNHPPLIEVECTANATAAFPKHVIPKPANTATEENVIADYNAGVAYAVSNFIGTIQKINLNTEEVISSSEYISMRDTFYTTAIGQTGDIYAPVHDAANFAAVQRIDSTSLAVKESVGTTGAFAGPINFAAKMSARHGYLMVCSEALGFFNGGMAIIDDGSALPPTNPNYTGAMRIVTTWGATGASSDQTDVFACDMDDTQDPSTKQYTDFWVLAPVSSVSFFPDAPATLYHLRLNDAGAQYSADGFGLSEIARYDLSSYFTSFNGHITTSAYIKFIPETNQLLIGVNNSLILWDIATASLAQPEYVSADGIQSGAWNSGLTNGFFVIKGANSLIKFDVGEWAVDTSYSTPSWYGGGLGSFQGVGFYDTDSNAYYGVNGDVNKLFLDRQATGDTDIRTILKGKLNEAGLDDSVLNLTDPYLSTPVHGFATKPGSADAQIAPIMVAFDIGVCEEDYKLKFFHNGAAPVVTITEDELAAHTETANPDASDDPVKESWEDERKLPVKYNVNYINIGREYQNDTAQGKRFQIIKPAIDFPTAEVAVGLRSPEANLIAARLLYLRWMNRYTREFATSLKYLWLSPGDLVTLSLASGNYITSLDKIDLGADNVVQLSGVSDDPLAHVDSTVSTGGGSLDPLPNPTQPSVTSIFYLVDVPAISDAHNDAGFLVVAAPIQDGGPWNGCMVRRSLDGGHFYNDLEQFSSPSDLGVTSTALPDAPRGNWGIIDRVSTLRVTMASGGADLASCTESQMLNGANYAIVGGEIVNFQNVTNNGDGTYTLDTFLRGRRGSDASVATHGVGEPFVYLNAGLDIDFVPDSGEIGVARAYQVQTLGDPNPPVVSKVFTDTAKRLWPYSPCSIEGARDGSGNLTITWHRRTRINGDVSWNDGVTEVPLSEVSESYSVDIYNGSTIVRTIPATSPTASYSAADQTTDFGSAQTRISVKIYQLSAIVGRGFAGSESI